MRRGTTIACTSLGLLAAAGALWWLLASPPAATTSGMPQAPTAHWSAPPLADPFAGTRSDRPGAALASNDDPLFAPGLRDAIEALLHAAGEASDPETLKLRLDALASQHFPPDLATRALALARRYVDYRVALGKLPPPADAQDPRALRTAAEQRQALRRQHFNQDEYEALFGQEQLLDNYTLARLEIERNPDLDAAQKRQALADAETQLPAPLRTERAQSVAHVALAQQTRDFNTQGTDDATRFTQRSATHGAAAAERLARLDQQERNWQTRLDQYQHAQAQGASAEQLQQLRHQQFTLEEQLRIDAALALRAHNTAPAR